MCKLTDIRYRYALVENDYIVFQSTNIEEVKKARVKFKNAVLCDFELLLKKDPDALESWNTNHTREFQVLKAI